MAPSHADSYPLTTRSASGAISASRLFAASARDNLRYGNWEASDAAIWDAARAANAETFLRALPEGLDRAQRSQRIGQVLGAVGLSRQLKTLVRGERWQVGKEGASVTRP